MKRKTITRNKPGLPAAALLLPVYLIVMSCVKEHTGKPLMAGEQLPAFVTTSIDGRTVRSTDLLGRPSAIILFDTTCPDCHRQLPVLEDLWKGHADRLNVLAIARDQDAGTVSAFWKQAAYTMPAAAPGNRSVYNLFDRDSGTGVPQVYVSDKQGTVLLTGNDRNFLTENTILRNIFQAE